LASIFLLSQKARSGGLEVKPHALSAAMAHYDHISRDAALEVLESWRGSPDLPSTIERLEGNAMAEGGKPRSE